mgnify:FL=1
MSTHQSQPLVIINTLQNLKAKGEKFTCLTAYESTLANIISQAGVEIILVGDSLGMVIQGHESTLPVTMDDLVYHLRNVSRGNVNSHLMADMPFMSYATKDAALLNAGLLMQNGAHSIKLEGGRWICDLTNTLAERGIPVCAHMGLTPQSINRIGGYFVQGRDTDKRDEMISEAKALESAGASLLLLECVPADLAKEITQSLSIPVIGIGAGVSTDAQVMVIHDLLGISCLEKSPKFVKNFLAENDSIQSSVKAYVKAVKEKQFPAEEHTFF